MLSRILSAFLLAFVPLFILCAQTPAPEPAETLLKAGLAEASSSGKSALVIFHASWCGWCKRLEAALGSPELKPVVDKHFVTVRLDVLERGEKKAALENPGAEEKLKSLGGEEAGLPFYAFLAADGKKVADSNMMPNGTNIGYPGSAEEIAAFLKVIRSVAPAMTDAEATAVSEYLTKHAPK